VGISNTLNIEQIHANQDMVPSSTGRSGKTGNFRLDTGARENGGDSVDLAKYREITWNLELFSKNL